MKMERIVKRFYDELDNGKIMGRKCPACGSVEFPPRIACTACGHFEMDWIEMSGKGEVNAIVATSKMTGPSTQVFQPFVMGCVRTEEGAELNAVVRGVTPEMVGEIRKQLPLPVKAAVFPRDGYNVVVYDLVTE